MMDRTDITPLRGYYPYHAPTGLPVLRSYGATRIALLRGYPYCAPTELSPIP